MGFGVVRIKGLYGKVKCVPSKVNEIYLKQELLTRGLSS